MVRLVSSSGISSVAAWNSAMYWNKSAYRIEVLHCFDREEVEKRSLE
jgi:hypothetical protein